MSVNRVWGDNELNTIARPYIGKVIADHVTRNVALIYRLLKSNRVVERLGAHIEETFLYDLYPVFDVSGYSTIPVVPKEVLRNMAFAWAEKTVPIAISETELKKNDSDEAKLNVVATRVEVAKMSMLDQLARDVWSADGTSPVGPGIIGVNRTVDDGTTFATYGQLSRTTYPGLASVVDAATSSLTLAALQRMWTNLEQGATSIWSRQDQYNRYVALLQTNQRYVKGPEVDRFMADAGFTAVMFNTAPWIIDSNVTDATSGPTNSKIFFLNENWWTLYVHQQDNFVARPFKEMVLQHVFVGEVTVTLQLTCRQPALQGVFANVTS